MRRAPAHKPFSRGAVLLEVVLALTVFVGMSMAVLGGLSTAVRSAGHVRVEAEAADLAVTLLSQVQIGLVAVEDAGPQDYEDEALQDWTWEVAVEPATTELTDVEASRVEIIIRHQPTGHTCRLSRLMIGTGTAETGVPL